MIDLTCGPDLGTFRCWSFPPRLMAWAKAGYLISARPGASLGGDMDGVRKIAGGGQYPSRCWRMSVKKLSISSSTSFEVNLLVQRVRRTLDSALRSYAIPTVHSPKESFP